MTLMRYPNQAAQLVQPHVQAGEVVHNQLAKPVAVVDHDQQRERLLHRHLRETKRKVWSGWSIPSMDSPQHGINLNGFIVVCARMTSPEKRMAHYR